MLPSMRSKSRSATRLADPADVLTDHRQWGVEEVRQREVVETDQRDSLLEAPFGQCAHRPDREDVPAAEHRRRRVVELEQRVHRLGRLVRRPDAGHDEARVRAKVACGMRVGESGVSKARGADGLHVDQGGDTTVPARKEVLRGENCSRAVVDDDGVGIHSSRLSVDEDRGGPRSQLRDEVVLPLARRHEHETVDAAGHEVVDELFLPVALLVEAGGQDRGAAQPGGVLERTQQAGGEGVRQILYKRPHEAGASTRPTQVARCEVGAVVQTAHRGRDPLPDVR